MDPELSAQIERLAREVSDLRDRVARLEGTRVEPIAAHAPSSDAPAASISARQLGFVGRTLIVLGGAYLIRALTDGGFISPPLGASFGLGYAAVLLAVAHRTAPRDRASASHHGLAAAMIGFPLIWETTTRLAILDAPSSAVALSAFFALGLFVAWHRQLSAVAWISLAFALATSLALLVGTGRIAFALALFTAAALCETLAFDARWRALRWPPALALDVVLLQLGWLLVRPDGLPDRYASISTGVALALLFALPVLYVGSIAARTIVRGRIITSFGIFQCTAALLIGLGGAARLLVVQGASLRWVGAIALLLGASSYAVAYAHADRARNFHYYLTIGVLLTLAGTALALDGAARMLAWAALAVATEWLGTRLGRKTIRFTAPLFVWAIFDLCSRGFTAWIADAAFVAAARSGVIAAIAVGMAWLAARRGWRELGWLVYPLIAAGGFKLLLEDFRVGRPASLFLSLALFGASLILAPRLSRK